MVWMGSSTFAEEVTPFQDTAAEPEADSIEATSDATVVAELRDEISGLVALRSEMQSQIEGLLSKVEELTDKNEELRERSFATAEKFQVAQSEADRLRVELAQCTGGDEPDQPPLEPAGEECQPSAANDPLDGGTTGEDQKIADLQAMQASLEAELADAEEALDAALARASQADTDRDTANEQLAALRSGFSELEDTVQELREASIDTTYLAQGGVPFCLDPSLEGIFAFSSRDAVTGFVDETKSTLGSDWHRSVRLLVAEFPPGGFSCIRFLTGNYLVPSRDNGRSVLSDAMFAQSLIEHLPEGALCDTIGSEPDIFDLLSNAPSQDESLFWVRTSSGVKRCGVNGLDPLRADRRSAILLIKSVEVTGE